MSLAEVLVAGALAVTLLAVAARIVVPGSRAWLRGQARSEAQRAVLVAGKWLRADLRVCAPESLACSGSRLSMATPGPAPRYDSHGRVLWAERVSYRLDEEGALRRQAEPLAQPTASAPPPEQSRPDPLARVVARGLAEVEFDTPTLGVVRIRLAAGEGEGRSELVTGARSLLAAP